MKLYNILILLMILTGCNENRSISYYNNTINRSYAGELSQIGFIKDISDPNTKDNNSVYATYKSSIIVIQSGLAYPDSELLKVIKSNNNVIAISGNPEIGNIDRIPLRIAAKNGGADYILGVWGTIRNDNNGKIFILISAILSDTKNGNWRYIECKSEPHDKAYSFFDPKGADDRQIQKLKEIVYADLGNQLYNKSAQQVDAPEPATMVSPALQTPIRPAR